MDVITVCNPLPANPDFAFHFSCFGPLSPIGRKNTSHTAVVIAAIGAIALFRGYRKHRSPRVLLLMVTGLIFIFGGAWWGDHLPSHAAEVFVTLIGSGFMISAHRMNHTFCCDCSCSHSE